MGLLSILAPLLAGGGQGWAQGQAQNPVNALNTANAAGAIQDVQAPQAGLQMMEGMQPPVGGSIMPQQVAPGQASVPMQKPAVAGLEKSSNVLANDAQSPAENPLLSTLKPLMPYLPAIKALPPQMQVPALKFLLQQQQRSALQQRQQLQDQVLQGRAKQLSEENSGSYNPRGKRAGGASAVKLANDSNYQQLKTDYLEAEKTYRVSPNDENKKAAADAKAAYMAYGKKAATSKKTSSITPEDDVADTGGGDGVQPGEPTATDAEGNTLVVRGGQWVKAGGE